MCKRGREGDSKIWREGEKGRGGEGEILRRMKEVQ